MGQTKRRAGRNRNGVGSVRKIRDNLFQGTIQLAPGDRRSVSGHTREEAEQKLAGLRVLFQQGRLPSRTTRTARDYLQDWLRDDVKPNLAPRTYENYELNVRRLDPYIGSVRLDSLKPDHIKAAYRGLMEKGLSARSVQQVHRTLRAAMRQAVKSENIYRDPTFGATPPRAQEREYPMLTPGQVRTLFATTEGHYLHPLWVVLATTGMRLGEALGLQWRDIDLDTGVLTIRRQAQRQVGKGVVLSDVKTPASRRALSLVPGTISVLRKHRLEQADQRVIAGLPWNEASQVFYSALDGFIDPGTVSEAFHRALESAGLPAMRVHDLRHMVSSYLQDQGRTGREAQEVLGHASELTTRRVYTHVMPDSRRDILLPVQAFFPPPEAEEEDVATVR